MKIALLSPRGPLYKHRGGIWKKSLRYAPLTLVTLESLIPKELNAKVRLFDEGIEDIPMDIDADIIGISVITGSAVRAYEIADEYRKQGKTVVLGGVHPTLMPKEAKEHADAVVIGYAEQTWPQLLHDYKAGKLKKYYHENKLDLSSIPFPSRHLLNKKDYITTNVVEATRGCANACEFCVVNSAWGNRQRQKPIPHVIKDLKSLGKRVVFIDLNLISDIDYAKKLFKAMIPLKKKWFGLTTVQVAWDDELLDLVAKSGCSGLLLGLESISKKTLMTTKKGFNTVKDYKYVVERLHSKGIAIMGCFVFGLDGDDKSVFKKTVEFCIETKIDLPRFSICTPFPNTALFNRLKKEGRIITEDWSLYDGQHVVFEPMGMAAEQLLKGTEKAWREVYSAKNIAKRITTSKSRLPVNILANLGYRYYAHNLHKYYTCGGARL